MKFIVYSVFSIIIVFCSYSLSIAGNTGTTYGYTSDIGGQFNILNSLAARSTQNTDRPCPIYLILIQT
ncbi:MAG: hypothetical protein KKF20_05565 [Bacteroidetes bacterium]|nr:hypothetical protein [Bacteroidota bacterium]MBU1421706.1 hypothetical protein [Bacteroidota bacterium]MBU2471858.1 hypothetical protein [Bacteroidota bacterium]MBU2635976.1 hypothetical protein [Bacteroidota bacterium]